MKSRSLRYSDAVSSKTTFTWMVVSCVGERPVAAVVIDIDGARILFDDGAWGLCRASNTGPVLVLRFEAKTPAQRDAIRAEVEAVVTRARTELGG